MHPQVVISSLMLLLTDAVVSYPQVNGVVGQPVTLPCTYSGALTSVCWGQGACPTFYCENTIVQTDTSGSHVTFQKHRRYKLKGSLLARNVSLTIENAVEADSGLYCCRVEHKGWFNDQKLTVSLKIKAAQDTSVPTSPSVSTSAPPTSTPEQNHKPVTSPLPTQPAETQPKATQETKTQSTSTPWHSYPTDGNGTVTPSSDGLRYNNQTEVPLAQKTQMTTAKKIYIGIGIFAAVLLSILVVLIIKRCLYTRNKLQQLRAVSFNSPQIGALQSAAEEGVRAEDNVYIIEEDVYVMY
ncbi:hepatitis A virus cellular receptor 1 isoform X2 [Trichechus manatus latirostris]|uniref:Hepatitis A virus cellular receptor 1 isoform X2 n=1 Tax=Trichechus manatus latirostris TaxID=127582 RepID=A0A2Y9QSJ2_TRIMA|nr:hepatitis A virus cellular receptor 1 isoform X2 [Trichechus manatus latirostris]